MLPALPVLVQTSAQMQFPLRFLTSTRPQGARPRAPILSNLLLTEALVLPGYHRELAFCLRLRTSYHPFRLYLPLPCTNIMLCHPFMLNRRSDRSWLGRAFRAISDDRLQAWASVTQLKGLTGLFLLC